MFINSRLFLKNMKNDSLELVVNEWDKSRKNPKISPVEQSIASVLYNLAISTNMGQKKASVTYPVELGDNPSLEERSLYQCIPISKSKSLVGGYVVIQTAQAYFGGTLQWDPTHRRFNYNPSQEKQR